MPAPTDVAGTRRILGVVKYLSKFIPQSLVNKDINGNEKQNKKKVLKKL